MSVPNVFVQATEKKKRSQKTEAHRENLKQLLDYLTHLKLTHAIDRNLHLLHTMKNPKPGTKTFKPEEFIRVYDILLQVRKQKLFYSEWLINSNRSIYIHTLALQTGKWPLLVF